MSPAIPSQPIFEGLGNSTRSIVNAQGWKTMVLLAFNRHSLIRSWPSPNSMSLSTCSALSTISSRRPATKTPRWRTKKISNIVWKFKQITTNSSLFFLYIFYLQTLMNLKLMVLWSKKIIDFFIVNFHVGNSNQKLTVDCLGIIKYQIGKSSTPKI